MSGQYSKARYTCNCKDIIQHNMRDIKHIVLGYTFIYKEYTGINIIINLIGFCIFKSFVISEKRTTPYNIVKLFKYELFILCTYFKKQQQIYWFYHIIQ